MVIPFIKQVCVSHAPTAGPTLLQVEEDGPRPPAGRMDQQPGPHHVFLQTGHRQVWGLGPAVARGAVCAQGGDAECVCVCYYDCVRWGYQQLSSHRASPSCTWCASYLFWSFPTPIFSWLLLQVIRDVLLLGHRQAFAWVDEWIGGFHTLLNNLITIGVFVYAILIFFSPF